MRKKIVHECACCGKGMQYSGKWMLYFYKVMPYIRYGDLSMTRPIAQTKVNLCPVCARRAMDVLRREGFLSHEEAEKNENACGFGG